MDFNKEQWAGGRSEAKGGQRRGERRTQRKEEVFDRGQEAHKVAFGEQGQVGDPNLQSALEMHATPTWHPFRMHRHACTHARQVFVLKGNPWPPSRYLGDLG